MPFRTDSAPISSSLPTFLGAAPTPREPWARAACSPRTSISRTFLGVLLGLGGLSATPRAAEQVPEPKREFRGAWVASVYNLDWPSKASLTVAQQQAELRAIMTRAVQLKLNALVLQVRPQCDALYASKREPWSAFLTGKMGRPPQPYYDPLEFAVTEAHARGLELHAWFNPFRALANADSPVSGDHVSKLHPEWVRRYGKQLWLDPGIPAARSYALDVILDVVRRYDIDGVHIDDYFYPYPVKNSEGGVLEFQDEPSFQQRRKGEEPSGAGNSDFQQTKADWRRANIDGFVAELYRATKAQKRWVKVGISPFGIWRPQVPSSIEAQLDSYGQLFADSRRWINEGWCDYLSPQLYWSISPAKQSFPVLLDWWRSQNRTGRHVWPGIATDRVGPNREAQEISNQITLTRQEPGSAGQIHWSAKSLLGNVGGVSDLLGRGVYSQLALVPASPWLGGGRLEKPSLSRAAGRLKWEAAPGGVARWWLLQTRRGKDWRIQLLPAAELSLELDGSAEAVAVRAIDRAGVAGEPSVLSF